MESKHTKGEWFINEMVYNDKPFDITNIQGSVIATINLSGNINHPINITEARANADRIIKCVNSHDKLIKVLQNITELAAFAINALPSGVVRNLLTEININALAGIDESSITN